MSFWNWPPESAPFTCEHSLLYISLRQQNDLQAPSACDPCTLTIESQNFTGFESSRESNVPRPISNSNGGKQEQKIQVWVSSKWHPAVHQDPAARAPATWLASLSLFLGSPCQFESANSSKFYITSKLFFLLLTEKNWKNIRKNMKTHGLIDYFDGF